MYPATLEELVPTLLNNSPMDFVDGKPLRYRRTDDGHFILWSIGMDGVDNDGRLPWIALQQLEALATRGLSVLEETDLVWPRPATGDEIDAARTARSKAEQQTIRFR